MRRRRDFSLQQLGEAPDREIAATTDASKKRGRKTSSAGTPDLASKIDLVVLRYASKPTCRS